MKRILIAEDNPASREFLTELLGAQGFEVIVTEDGESALQRVKQEPPDLVLLDIQMPGMDGYEVLRRLRADKATAALKIVACTAYAMAGDEDKALAAGFDGYITKPIRAAALRQQIQKLFDGP
jgi:two-component system cell cycle response regulator DivK